MLLILVRHADAGDRDPEQWPDDDLRPLTPDGRRKQADSARTMKKLGIMAEHLFSSPLVRAMQTAEIIAEIHAMKRPEIKVGLGLGCNTATVVEMVANLPDGESPMLVGHEPAFSQVAAALIGRSADAVLELKKSGVIGIEFDGKAAVAAGRLVYLLKPKFLRQK